MTLASPLVGQSYPVGRGLASGLRLGLGSCMWVGLTLGLRSLSDSLSRPMTLLALCLVALEVASASEPLRAWTPWGVIDPTTWERAVPWVGLAMALLLAGGGTALAVRRFERMDV